MYTIFELTKASEDRRSAVKAFSTLGRNRIDKPCLAAMNKVYPNLTKLSSVSLTILGSENHTTASVCASEQLDTKWQQRIRVYSRILDAGHEWLRLWLVIRGLDKSGSGRLTFRVSDIAEAMATRPANVYRWLSQGNLHGWRHKVTDHGVVTLYYNGINQIASYLGSSDLGAIFIVPIHTLGDRSLCKGISTQADAQLYQRQAYHASCVGISNLKRKLIKRPWDVVEKNLFSSNPSDNPPGGTVPTKKQTYAYHGQFYSVPGISLVGLSNRAGWCVNTIQKRLSNSWRKDRDIDFVGKQRSARVISDAGLAYSINQLGGLVKEVNHRTGKVKVFRTKMMGGECVVLELGTNIYAEQIELSSAQRLRSRVKAALKAEPMD